MRGKWTVGIDFGGTMIKAGLVDPHGRVAAERVLSSRAAGRPAQFLAAAVVLVETLAAGAGVRPRQLRGVGIGAPGPVDIERGVVHTLVNVPGWREVPLRRALERCFGCPCAVENDAKVFALAEARFGAGRGTRHLIGVTLGTGVGSGLVLNGTLYRGASGAAGELGHTVIDPRGRQCGCGARGCLEAHVGTEAILALARRAIRRRAGPLRTLAREARGRLSPELVSRAAEQGDAAARGVWVEVGRSLGVGLGNAVNLLNPERIVIGGGVANAWPFFLPSLLRTLRAQAMEVSARTVRVVRARLGARAGIVGAAVLVWNEAPGRSGPSIPSVGPSDKRGLTVRRKRRH